MVGIDLLLRQQGFSLNPVPILSPNVSSQHRFG